uniref:Uncharacterized protein n=1 Tax=Arundo donax TaxID=35708 RepID=A0A0A8YDW6_ARUDO
MSATEIYLRWDRAKSLMLIIYQ